MHVRENRKKRNRVVGLSRKGIVCRFVYEWRKSNMFVCNKNNLEGKIKSNAKRKTVVEFLRMVGTCEEIGGSREQG